MSLFTPSHPPLIGVDISSSAVKVLQLAKVGNRYRVEHYAVEPLPDKVMNEKNIVDVAAVGEAIQRALARSGSKARFAAAAVAGSSVITKIIPMPSDLEGADLEAQVMLEAANHVPYPIDEVNLDFEVLGPLPNSADTNQVLLAACRSETVESRVEALEMAGLTPRVMDVEGFAVENAFALIAGQLSAVGQQGVVALIDVGSTMTQITVIKGGRSIYHREQVFGGRQLTDEIMRRYGLNYEEAGIAKRQGGLPETYDEEVLTPFKEGLVQQISRLLQFFYAASEHHRVDQIILAGGSAAIPGVDRMVEEQLGVPALVANPMAQMSLGPRVQAHALTQDAPALMIAAGLAMRNFD